MYVVWSCGACNIEKSSSPSNWSHNWPLPEAQHGQVWERKCSDISKPSVTPTLLSFNCWSSATFSQWLPEEALCHCLGEGKEKEFRNMLSNLLLPRSALCGTFYWAELLSVPQWAKERKQPHNPRTLGSTWNGHSPETGACWEIVILGRYLGQRRRQQLENPAPTSKCQSPSYTPGPSFLQMCALGWFMLLSPCCPRGKSRLRS